MNTNQTPCDRAVASGMASTWSSPDGYSKVQRFSNGQRFLHKPDAAFPLSLSSDYPDKPEGAAEYYHNYGYEKPSTLGAWQWSTTFGRWSRLVTFADGWHGYTYPKIS